ncbi:hypothetical protein SEA_AMGINE_81 [Mycobacterium phage Amgine]|uniref:Helix-turn-helix DNA binding domain protein n=1 Tax=Mycobacterium phage Amgine TaxID=2015817 RepID=A0A222ZNE5_9CAUD|nr:hypothetical protein I5G84_gp81 [Mycobacterium phage Amgine]ASR85681.1 hypothetical protein SEA_AMGINE_81 [Mycobacterium phage Amgine]
MVILKTAPWPFYHQRRAARLLGLRRRDIGGLVARGSLRGVRVHDGAGGWVWAVNCHDVDTLAASPNYRHARDIPDIRMLRAIDDATQPWGNALRGDVTRVLGGVPLDSQLARGEVPGVPWKVVLAKFRRVAGRGLADGCDCGCRGDWSLTDKGRALVELSRCVDAPCYRHAEHADRAARRPGLRAVLR